MSSIKIIDYRNAKYQGQINKSIKHGLGMLIDDNFTLIIATWNKNKLHGPSIIIYPENIIFYGQYQNGLPSGISIFQLENMINLYCNFKNTSQSSFKIDSTIVIVIQKSSVLIEAMIDMNQIKIISDYPYKNQQQKFKKIKDILKSQIKQSMQSGWINYLDMQISKNYPDYIQIKKIIRNRNKQIVIGFKKGDTVGGCFTQGVYSQPLSIGFYKNQHIFKDLGRKYIDTPNGKIIEEGIYNVFNLNNKKQKNLSQSAISVNSSNVYTYHKSEQQRPFHAIRAIQKYFRQSLSFNNSFVNLAEVYKTQSICFKVETALLMNTVQKYAQVQLQETKSKKVSRIKNDLLQKVIKQYEREKNENIQELNLQQIKQQIYQALKKRNKPETIKSNHLNLSNLANSRRNTTQHSSSIKVSQIQYNNHFQKSIISHENLKNKIRQKQRSRVNNQSPQFNNKRMSRQQKIETNSPDKKNTKNKPISKSPNRYKYVPIQNMDILTKDYQRVQKQILKQTPRTKKKSIYIRNSTYIQNKKQDNQQDGFSNKSHMKNSNISITKNGSKGFSYNYKY